MQIYPAIDIQHGQCIQLRSGNRMTACSNTPIQVARMWKEMGASYLHVMDHDMESNERDFTFQLIRQIIEVTNVPVQVGGNIRNMIDMETLFQVGATRVVLDAKIAVNSELLTEALSNFGADNIVVLINTKGGIVIGEDWDKQYSETIVSFGHKMQDYGVKTIIYNDIDKCGMLQYNKVEYAKQLAEMKELEVIACGGVMTLNELENIKSIQMHGAIIGQAFYEHRLNLKNVIDLFEKGA